MAFFTSLLTVSSLATWILLPLNALFLTLDGIIYSLVAYSYKLFMIMATLNFTSILIWVEPLINRIEVIIMVLIAFRIGQALIQYMINPEALTKDKVGGAAIIKNIVIATALFIFYPTFFSMANELTILVIGNPSTSAPDNSVLTQYFGVDWSEQNGLVQRFIFGNDSSDNIEDFGKNLAVMTLQIFLHGKGSFDGNSGATITDSSSIGQVYSEILSDGSSSFDFMKIVTVVDDIDRDVEYKWPLISSVMGLFLIYSIVKICIDIGVRMFKIIILQIIAPIAIASTIIDGFESKMWKDYIKVYGTTFMDVFFRVASMLISTVFISTFYTNMWDLYGLKGEDGATKFFILIIVIVAAYRFAILLPKFLDSILGTKLGEEKSGFGKLMGSVAGFAAGGIGGVALGAAAGLNARQILANGWRGAFGGANAGGKSDSIAKFFSGQGQNLNNTAQTAGRIAQHGVGGTMARYVGKQTGMNEALNVGVDSQRRALDNKNKDFQEQNARYDAIDQATVEAIKGVTSSYNYSGGTEAIKFGSNIDSFAQKVADNDKDVISKQMDIDRITSRMNAGYKGSQAQIKSASAADAAALSTARSEQAKARRDAEDAARKAYRAAQDASGASNGTTYKSRTDGKKSNNENIRVNNEQIRKLDEQKIS